MQDPTYLPYRFHGDWRFAVRRRTPAGVGVTYTALGWCGIRGDTGEGDCHHQKPQQAVDHFREYLIAEQTRMGVQTSDWRPCQYCWPLGPPKWERVRYWVVKHFSGPRQQWLAEKLGYANKVALVAGANVFYLCVRHHYKSWLERLIPDPARMMS